MKTGDLNIYVSIDKQEMELRTPSGEIVCTYPISTSKFGLGQEEGSNCTPLGQFVIRKKIGESALSGTIFISREPAGQWDSNQQNEDDLVLTRILWLDGVESHNCNTFDRYIYVHGTNQEDLIGTRASHGCIRMLNEDVIDLFDRVSEGTSVDIRAEDVDLDKIRNHPKTTSQPSIERGRGSLH